MKKYGKKALEVATGDTAAALRTAIDPEHPVFPGEKHAVKVTGPNKGRVYSYMGPGTKFEKRQRLKIKPINDADRIAEAQPVSKTAFSHTANTTHCMEGWVTQEENRYRPHETKDAIRRGQVINRNHDTEVTSNSATSDPPRVNKGISNLRDPITENTRGPVNQSVRLPSSSKPKQNQVYSPESTGRQ